MPSSTARCAGATNASGRSASTVASVNWPGYWISAWSSWRSVKTTGSRRSGTGSEAASPGAGSGTSSVPAGRCEGSTASSWRTRPAFLTSAAICSTSMPSQPETVRVYSGRRLVSRIEPMIGATAFIACTRPSAVSRSKRRIVVRTANSNIGTASSTRARTAASPLAMRSSHGSMPSGATATNDCAAQRWSSPKAFIAAFWPAASPSKVKMTRAWRAVGLVAHDPAQDLDVLDAEGRAAGGDRALDAGQVGRP